MFVSPTALSNEKAANGKSVKMITFTLYICSLFVVVSKFLHHQKVCSQRHGSLADALASAISSCSLQPACHRYLLTRTVTASGRAKAKRLLNIHCGVRRLQAVGALSQLEERLLQRSNQIVHVNHKPEIARNNVNNKRKK